MVWRIESDINNNINLSTTAEEKAANLMKNICEKIASFSV